MQYVAIDTETFPIGPAAPFPQLVCVQLCTNGAEQLLSYYQYKDRIREALHKMLGDDNVTFVGTNLAFDFVVLSLAFPELEPAIWEKFARGLIASIDIAEMISNIGSFGHHDFIPLTEGVNKAVQYRQEDLEREYLGIDRSADKKGGVRVTYEQWATVPTSAWPAEYIKYAMDDVRNALAIYGLQLNRFKERGTFDSVLAVLGFRTAASFALAWATYNGMRTNPEEVSRLDELVRFERDLSRYPALVQRLDGIDVGIMTAPVESRPYARGAKNHLVTCTNKKTCDCPPKMVPAEPAKLSRKRLAQKILDTAKWATAYANAEIDLFLTDGGIEKLTEASGKKKISLPCTDPLLEANPEWVSTDDSNYSQVAPYSEEIRQYAKREEWGQVEKLYVHKFFWDVKHNMNRADVKPLLNKAEPPSWFSPQMVDLRISPLIRFGFWPIVSSGRTGSRASSLYPSMNGQNIDPRVRKCFQSRDYYVMLSQDIVGLELISISWRCESLGIPSVLAKLLKNGDDAHGYLGASLACRLAKRHECPPEFAQACADFERGNIDRYSLYKEFTKLKKGDVQSAKFHKRWRTFAKPVGLGAWGALGKHVMQHTANAEPYNLDVTVEDCADGIEIWRECFPENRQYFEHMKGSIDYPFSREGEDGKMKFKYKYTTPLGMLRRNVTWNEACNCYGLQSPSAEAMLIAVFRISRGCRDWTQNSKLYGCLFLDFIHDEVILDVPILSPYSGTIERVKASEEILRSSLQVIFQGFPVGVESVLMYTWNKFAKEAYTEDGFLVPADTRPNPTQP